MITLPWRGRVAPEWARGGEVKCAERVVHFPILLRLRAASSPLQGEVEESHSFNKRWALPERILALSASESGTVSIHSIAGGFVTNGQSTANRI